MWGPMALIYRAIWDDDRTNLIRAGEIATKRWFKKKGIDIGVIADGVFEGKATHPWFRNEYEYRVIISHAKADGVAAYQLRLFEDSEQAGHRISSQYTVLATEEVGGTHWVDVERVATDPYTRFNFRIPSLVNDLIKNGLDPRVGQVRLEQGPKIIEVGGLAGLIRNQDRKIPLVVFSHDRAGANATMERAKLAHERLRGVAQVFVLPTKDVDTFRELVGDDLSVWGGGARLYLPNWGPGGLRPERHRYVSGPIGIPQVE